MEHEQLLVSMANNRDEFMIISRIQGHYNAAMSEQSTHANNVVLYQLLTFTHYHFLFATAALWRCHLSEAFASCRAAVDAALIAAQVIHDRPSQIAYAKREKPFDKLNRHYKNLIRDGKPLPSPLIPELLKLHDMFSSFASHADVNSFVHRVDLSSRERLVIDYFQYSKNETERKIHALSLFHTFVMILDVFAPFLVEETKTVPESWRAGLHELGQKMEQHQKQLKEKLADANRG